MSIGDAVPWPISLLLDVHHVAPGELFRWPPRGFVLDGIPKSLPVLGRLAIHSGSLGALDARIIWAFLVKLGFKGSGACA